MEEYKDEHFFMLHSPVTFALQGLVHTEHVSVFWNGMEVEWKKAQSLVT